MYVLCEALTKKQYVTPQIVLYTLNASRNTVVISALLSYILRVWVCSMKFIDSVGGIVPVNPIFHIADVM